MKDLINFQYEDREVRTVTKDGIIWFVAKDVCDILEIGNSRQALTRLDEDEKGVILNDTPGGKQELAIVNEPGLYSLILSSRKPEAKAFKRWVTHEVLPAIRKDGVYSTDKPGMLIEYKKQVILIEALMDERKNYLEMNREIIKQVKLLEKRVCELEDRSGMFASSYRKPTVQIGSTNADDCKSLFVEFVFSGKCRSFDAMNAFLQNLEEFLVQNGYHRERQLV